MTIALAVGDKVTFRVQGTDELNVVIVEHGEHPSLLRVTTQTKQGETIDTATLELDQKT